MCSFYSHLAEILLRSDLLLTKAQAICLFIPYLSLF